MEVVKETELPGYPGRKLVEVRATAIPGYTTSILKDATYWIDGEQGVVIKARLNLLPDPKGVGHREITLEYKRDAEHSEKYYHYNEHNHKYKSLFNPGASRQDDSSGPDRPR